MKSEIKSVTCDDLICLLIYTTYQEGKDLIRKTGTQHNDLIPIRHGPNDHIKAYPDTNPYAVRKKRRGESVRII